METEHATVTLFHFLPNIASTSNISKYVPQNMHPNESRPRAAKQQKHIEKFNAGPKLLKLTKWCYTCCKKMSHTS